MVDIGTPRGFQPRAGGGFEPIPTTRPSGGRAGGRVPPSKPGEPLPSIPAGVTSVTRPQRGGGTITVTRSGKVTIRDARGALVERFQTTEREARSFISKPQTQSERIISTLKRQGRRVFLGTSGEIISIDPITGRKTVIAGRQVIARVPISAKVSVPGILRARRIRGAKEKDIQRRIAVIEKRAVEAGEKVAKKERLKFMPFEIDENLSESAKEAIKREQERVQRLLGIVPTIAPIIKKGIRPFIKKQIALIKERNPKQLVESTIRFLAHITGFNFATEVGEGIAFNLKAAFFDLAAKRKISLGTINRDSISVLNQLRKLDKKKKKGQTITSGDKKDLVKKFGKWRNTTKALRVKGAIPNEKARKVYSEANAKLARQVSTLVVTVAILRGIGPTVKILTDVGLTIIGAVFSAKQGLETLKRPTAENWGKLGFFAMPTALSILRTFRRFGPSFRPSVKNAPTMKNTFLNKLKENEAVLRQAKKVKDKRVIRLIEKQNRALRQGIKELNWIISNPEIIKTRDFNPIVHNRNFKRLQGSYKTGLHVSTEPRAGKLFGRKITKQLTGKEIFRKILKKGKVVQPTKVGKLSTRTSLDRLIIKVFKRNKVILGGGRALNIQVKLLRRRFTSDLDGKVARNAKGILQQIARGGNKIAGRRRYVVKSGRLVSRLFDTQTRKFIIDLKNVGGKKFPFTLNPQGLRVETKIGLLFEKAKAIADPKRFERKGKQDVGDIARLTGRRIRVKDILSKHKNPSNVFEVTRQLKGMGRDRMAFDETHMFFDFDAPIAYSQGKPFSIIKFPRTRISKFPPNLRQLITKAANGQLSTGQGISLRRALNRHIKANPNKFFISPRTASLPIGEREIALAEISKFIKRDTYRTFDNDLQKFVSIFEVGFKKGTRLSLARKFINSWKSKPFTTLRLRLTNPDILLMRRYTNIVRRDIKLTAQQTNIFLSIFNKVIRSVKKVLGKLLSKKQISKLNRQRRILQRKIKRLGDTKVEIRLKDEFRIKLRKIESKLGIIRKVEKVIKPIKVAVRKGRRIVRISGEAISTTNARVVNNVRTIMGNIGIRVSFAKVNTRARIRNITTPISRRLNILTLKLKRQVRISSNKITRSILITLNKIRTILGNLNIKLRFAKLKVGQVIKVKVTKVRVPIRKAVRILKITKERVNVSTRKFIRKTETSLGNVNIRLKFAKFRTKERVSNISLSIQRKINIRILRMKRRIRISRENINAIVRRGVNSINTLLKKFNYKIKVESIKIKAVTRVAIRKAIRPTKRLLVISKERLSSINSRIINTTKSKLGNLGIRVNFVKFRTKLRIKNISLDVQRLINRNILLIRRALRVSGNRITQPIISRVKIIQNSLRRFNIELRVIKLKVGARVGRIKRIVAKPIRKVKGLIRISGERLSTINTRVISNVKTKLGNAGIKVNFIKFNVKARIRNITSVARRRINTNILLIRRALRVSKNKITRPIISKLNTIKRLLGNFNIKIKFIKFKVGQRIAPVKEAVIRIAKKPVRVIKRTQLKIFNRIQRTVNGVNRTIGNLGIRIKFKKAQLRLKIGRLTTPLSNIINRNIRALRRELIKTKGRTNSKIRLLIKKINRLIPIEIKIIRPGVKKKVPVSKPFKVIPKKVKIKKPLRIKIGKLKPRERRVIRRLNRRLRILRRKLPRTRTRKTRARITRTIRRIERRIRKITRPRIPKRVRKPVRVRVPVRVRPRVRVRKRVPVRARVRVRVPIRPRPRVRPRPRIPIVPRVPKIIIPPDIEKKKKLIKLSGRVIQRQRFIYLNDLYSAIYDIKATPTEKRAFLKVGRIFTGAERRAIIRGRRRR